MITIALTRCKLSCDDMFIVSSILRRPLIYRFPCLRALVVMLKLNICSRYFIACKVLLCERHFRDGILHLDDIIDHIDLDLKAFCSRNKCIALIRYLIKRAVDFCQSVISIYIGRNSFRCDYLNVIHRVAVLVINDRYAILINIMSIGHDTILIKCKFDIL